jgi:hypothetical protein
MESYRPILQSRQYLRRIRQRTVGVYFPQTYATSQSGQDHRQGPYVRGNGRRTRDLRILVRSGRLDSQEGH